MQLTFLERKVSQRTLRRAARLSANASFPPAPSFSRVSGCPLASALNSRRVAARDNSRPWQLAIARAHQAASARPRPSARALNSRPWQLAAARAHQAASARARGLHPWQFAARGRAGQFTPWSGELRSRLCKPPAHVRAGGCAWNFLRPRTLYFTGPALDFCEFSLNFPCIFGKIGIRKQPLSQIY